MGWLRLVGSLKLYFSFAKEPCKRDNILQKRPIILRSLLIVATPYLIMLTGRRMGLSQSQCRFESLPWSCVTGFTHRERKKKDRDIMGAETDVASPTWKLLRGPSHGHLVGVTVVLVSSIRPVPLDPNTSWLLWLDLAMGWLRWVGSLEL